MSLSRPLPPLRDCRSWALGVAQATGIDASSPAAPLIDVRSDSGHSRPVGLDPEPIKTPTGTAGRYVQHRDQPTQAQLDAVNINQVLLGQLEQLAMAAVEAIDLMFATPRRSAAVMESALGAKIGALVGEIESASVLAEQLRQQVESSTPADGGETGLFTEPQESVAGPGGSTPLHSRETAANPWGAWWSTAHPGGRAALDPCGSATSPPSSSVLAETLDDPFVDHPRATPDSAVHVHSQVPDYHPDVTSMPLHKIFADQPRSAPFLQGCSRRVLLTNLPPDVSAAQVLRAVHGYGGVVSASIVPDLGAPATGSRAAMVEFVYAASAAQYVEYARHRPQSFRAADGSVHTAAVHLIPTLSYPHATGDHRLLQKNGTRALAFSNFPPAAIWYVLCLVGTRRVSNVQYNEQTGELTLEFESLFDANRALDTVERRLPLTLRRARCKTDSSQEWPSIVQDVHDHVPSTHIEQQWNRPPYNTHDYPRQEAPPPAAPERKPASPTPREKMAAQYDVSPSRLSSYIAERDAFEETEYRIIGSTIKLTRRGWGWSISAEDDMKLLMANALHEPDLADEWDRHFAAHDSVNLRTWERYGLLARHRRERAAEQGLEEWRVPQCGAACEWGCCSIKAAPVPRAVAQYLAA